MKFIRLALVLLIQVGQNYTTIGQSISEMLAHEADIIIDINGNGDYTSIQEGINAIPDYNDEWFVLLVRKGIYREKVILNYKKTKLILVGEDVDSTIITYDDYGDKMLIDGDPNKGGHTFSTYTFRADPNDFQAFNITFQNTTRLGQGVAFHSNGDRQILYHCKLLGYQDTYFDNFRTRRYIKDCYIEGRTDFIFGFGVTLFDSCQINMVDSSGWITAASTPQYYEFGYVFKNCILTSESSTPSFFLGRPWFPYSNTVFYNCYESKSVVAKGWENWSGRAATSFYREYNCTGPGSDTTERVSFSHQLDPQRAKRYTIDMIFAASNFPAHKGPVVDSMEFMLVRNRFEKSGYVARADTILFAGRDYWPKYPTDNWTPEIYNPIYTTIRAGTEPFATALNK